MSKNPQNPLRSAGDNPDIDEEEFSDIIQKVLTEASEFSNCEDCQMSVLANALVIMCQEHRIGLRNILDNIIQLYDAHGASENVEALETYAKMLEKGTMH